MSSESYTKGRILGTIDQSNRSLTPDLPATDFIARGREAGITEREPVADWSHLARILSLYNEPHPVEYIGDDTAAIITRVPVPGPYRKIVDVRLPYTDSVLAAMRSLCDFESVLEKKHAL